MKYVYWIVLIVVLVAVGTWVYDLRPAANVVNDKETTQTVSVYFALSGETDIEFVEAERQISKIADETLEDTLLTTLREWVKGPTSAEAEEGLGNSLNEGTQVNSASIGEGLVTIDFNETFDTPMGGSARVMAISRQIQKIIGQFEELKDSELKLTVGGGAREAVLEP